jgi:hypothetical protein
MATLTLTDRFNPKRVSLIATIMQNSMAIKAKKAKFRVTSQLKIDQISEKPTIVQLETMIEQQNAVMQDIRNQIMRIRTKTGTEVAV